MSPIKLQDRIANQPKAWWQRAIAGERLPKPVFRRPKCEGTVEDHRTIALDVRELMRKQVFAQPVGSVFPLQLRFPWLRMMRLESTCLHLELVTGRTVIVPLIWASCGVIGERLRLACPLCGRRVCVLYYVGPRLACRHCNSLWYAAQRTSSTARRFLTKRKPAEARRLWPNPERTIAAKAAPHVAENLRASLCSAGAYRACVIMQSNVR